jgi:hypothetical protein
MIFDAMPKNLNIFTTYTGINFTIQLISLLHRAIVHPRGKVIEITGHCPLHFDGKILKKLAFCRIIYTEDWHVNMPIVFPEAPWIKKDPDWHMYDNGALCYELDVRWHETLSNIWHKDGASIAAHTAAQWLTESAGLLLGRHYYASLTGIKKWPTEWADWKHGNEGVRQYDRLKNPPEHESRK